MKVHVTKYGYPDTREAVEKEDDFGCLACEAVHRHGGCDMEGVCFVEIEQEDGKRSLRRVSILRAHVLRVAHVHDAIDSCLMACVEVTSREADLEIAKACAEGRD